MQSGNGASDPQNLTKALVVPDPYISEPRYTQSMPNINLRPSLTKVQIYYIGPFTQHFNQLDVCKRAMHKINVFRKRFNTNQVIITENSDGHLKQFQVRLSYACSKQRGL